MTHHFNRGCEYVSIRDTQRLAEAAFVVSVGSVGDSYDNVLAKTRDGLYKTELIYRQGPWKNRDSVELPGTCFSRLVQIKNGSTKPGGNSVAPQRRDLQVRYTNFLPCADLKRLAINSEIVLLLCRLCARYHYLTVIRFSPSNN